MSAAAALLVALLSSRGAAYVCDALLVSRHARTFEPPHERGPTRVLAYGDSLTAGFYAGGGRFHPYAHALSVALGGCTVDHLGLSGLTAAQMVASLGRSNASGSGDLDSTSLRWVALDVALREAQPPYSLVSILAGTNDLGQMRLAGGPRTPETVAADIVALHRLALASGARTAVLTVPQPAYEQTHPLVARIRADLNERLRQFAAAHANETTLVDVDALLPHLSAPPAERALRWDDGLHFTPAGYDELAHVIHDNVADVAPPCGDASNATAAGHALRAA